jgi:SAM-dependent methyltransferase
MYFKHGSTIVRPGGLGKAAPVHLDVTELRAFYASPLGRTARLLLRERLRQAWPGPGAGLTVGFGYAGPLLPALEEGARPPVLLAPAAQGVSGWPRGRPNRAALVEEDRLPLPDASVDRLLVCHALEHTENSRRLLREFWRVLAPEGRIIAVLPHRRSPWALSERTPFGHGRPYSVGQANRLLADALLQPVGWRGALHSFPGHGRLAIRLLRWAERPGARLWPTLSGVLLVEAMKVVEARIDGAQTHPALAYARA